jgi:hypothetical protein
MSVCLCSYLSYPECKARAPYYIVICGLSDSTIFFTLSQKRHNPLKSVTKHKICVLIFPTALSYTFLIPKITQQDILINVRRSSCKVPVILVRF